MKDANLKQHKKHVKHSYSDLDLTLTDDNENHDNLGLNQYLP